jgi:hypothetical protein
MKEEKNQKMLLMTMVASIISVLLLVALLIGSTGITASAIGKRDNPVCLWQITGQDNEFNLLIYQQSVCEIFFEKYADLGGCSTQGGYLVYQDRKGNEVTWVYDAFCYKSQGDKRMFTILSGHLGN